MKKTEKWLIIDEKGKIIESYRNKCAARNMLPELRKIHIAMELTIISRVEHEKTHLAHLKRKGGVL